MSWIIYALLILIVLIMVLLVFVMIMKTKKTSTTQIFEVFQIYDNKLTVLSGIPVTYNISDIQEVVFSSSKSMRGSFYTGIMRIVKANGKKSRPFMFDSSAYKKRVVFYNSRQEIEEAIQFLMNDLKTYNIPCSKR